MTPTTTSGDEGAVFDGVDAEGDALGEVLAVGDGPADGTGADGRAFCTPGGIRTETGSPATGVQADDAAMARTDFFANPLGTANGPERSETAGACRRCGNACPAVVGTFFTPS